MIVCQCRRITDRDVNAALERGAEDLVDLATACGAGTDCRGCHPTLEAMLEARRVAVPPKGDRRRLAVVAA
jgi:bacterioferritin-associated ferredoxin